jgi:enoyl-CoA hydratase/carnithine racemase
VVVRALVSADRVAAWNAVNQVVADEDLYREAHAIATRLSSSLLKNPLATAMA